MQTVKKEPWHRIVTLVSDLAVRVWALLEYQRELASDCFFQNLRCPSMLAVMKKSVFATTCARFNTEGSGI
jgi:hypothetical protein